jgi:hypothetical protein
MKSECVNCGKVKNESTYLFEGEEYCSICIITLLAEKGIIYIKDGYEIIL